MLIFRKIKMILYVNPLVVDDFSGSVSDAVRLLHPFHRTIGFLLFRNICLFGKYGYKQLKHPLRLLIYLCQMSVQRSGSQQIVIPNFVILLQIPPVSLPPNSDFNFFRMILSDREVHNRLAGYMCRLFLHKCFSSQKPPVFFGTFILQKIF